MTSKARAHTGGRSGTKASLSLPTQKILVKLLKTLGKRELTIEMHRQFLAHNENMEPYSVFQRLDRNEDGFVTSMEILNFIRDNGVNHVTEADCYYVVKFFDSDEDGKLNYPDFM